MEWHYSQKLYQKLIGDELGVGIFNSKGLLTSFSPSFPAFLFEPHQKTLLHRSIFSLCPELIGNENELEVLRLGGSEEIFVERIYRPNLNGKPGYISMRVISFRNGWIVAVRDTTSTGEMEQRITQQRNELFLLSSELEKAHFQIDQLLRTFVPSAVVDNLLKDKTAHLGGEIRMVTILFADLRGYTAWAEKISPQEAITALNRLLTAAFEILNKYGATINQLMGDGFMSIFNAPLDQPDHAALALRCAHEIANLPGLAENVRFGVGVNTGFAMVGNVGSSLAMDYSAIGNTTNIAYRLQQLAGPGIALFSEATMEQAGEDFNGVPQGTFDVKGIQQPLAVYKLVG